MKKQKFQTATEYLIILAVVIIIALILVVALGGFPGIGGGTGTRGNTAQLATQPVGVASHAIGTDYATIELVNNEPIPVRVESLQIGNETCVLIPPVILFPGESELVGCSGVFGAFGGRYDHDLVINYVKDDLSFTSGGNLRGSIADRLEPVARPFAGLSGLFTVGVCPPGSGSSIPHSQCTGLPSEASGSQYVVLRMGNNPIALFQIDFSQAPLDWSQLTGGTDVTGGISFVHHPNNYEGTGINSVTLLIPAAGGSLYWICPHATSLSQVTPNCPDGYQGSMSAQDGYYQVPVPGTGGADLIFYGSSGAYSTSAMTFGWGFRW